MHPLVLLILSTYLWLQRKHVETGAPSGAVYPVYLSIIREIHLMPGAPSGAVNPVYLFIIRASQLICANKFVSRNTVIVQFFHNSYRINKRLENGKLLSLGGWGGGVVSKRRRCTLSAGSDAWPWDTMSWKIHQIFTSHRIAKNNHRRHLLTTPPPIHPATTAHGSYFLTGATTERFLLGTPDLWIKFRGATYTLEAPPIL